MRDSVSSTNWSWLAAAGVVFLAGLFLHLPITDVLDGLVKRVGFLAYDGFMRRGFLALGLAALAAVVVWRGPQKATLVTATAVLLTAALVAQRVLLVAAVENVHYLQYALLTCLIARAGPSPEGAFLIAGGLGFSDEAYQYLALPRGTPPYFDWNDGVLNAMGAAFGIVAVLVISGAEMQRPLVSRRAVVAIMCLGIVGALFFSPPVWSPFYSTTPGGRLFHRLSASEAIAIVGGLWIGVRALLAEPADERIVVGAVRAGSNSIR
jgi:hypothetical protein